MLIWPEESVDYYAIENIEGRLGVIGVLLQVAPFVSSILASPYLDCGV